MPDSLQLSSLGKSDSSFSESSGLFYKDEALEKDLNGDVYTMLIFLYIYFL